MVQIISISEARSNLSSLVTQVAQTRQPILILRDSSPVAEIHPYHEEKHPVSDTLLSIKGTWDLRKEAQAVRDEVEKRIAKTHNE